MSENHELTEEELQKYLKEKFPKENEKCEWKEFKRLKHAVSGKAGDDIISYISAIANMEGGHLVIGVEDGTLQIVGLEDLYNYTPDNIKIKILNQCPNLSSENFWVQQFVSTDTNKIVWVFHIPKHLPRRPVFAHNRRWQRIDDNLVEMRPERENLILAEPLPSDEQPKTIRKPEIEIEITPIKYTKSDKERIDLFIYPTIILHNVGDQVVNQCQVEISFPANLFLTISSKINKYPKRGVAGYHCFTIPVNDPIFPESTHSFNDLFSIQVWKHNFEIFQNGKLKVTVHCEGGKFQKEYLLTEIVIINERQATYNDLK